MMSVPPDLPSSPPPPPEGGASSGLTTGASLRLGASLGLTGAVARAGLFALRDGYFREPDLHDVAARSFLLDLAWGALGAVPVAILALSLARGARPARRLALSLAVLSLSVLFVSGRLPPSPFHTPGFDSSRAWLAHGATLAVAALAVALVARRPGGPFALLAQIGAVAAIAFGGTAAIVLARADPPPSGTGAILVSLDTLRLDRLGASVSGIRLTPTLDALAEESVQFTRAYSPQPFTLTAHMSMLTGLSPSVHSLDAEHALPESVTTLAESFRDAGYVTAAFVDTVTWLRPRYGFDRGFSIYRQIEGDASSKDEQVRLLLDDIGDRPMFLFVHLYDAHSDESELPYDADAPHLQRLTDWYQGDFTGCEPELGCASRLLLEMNRLGKTLDGDDRRYLASLYDAGLASLDDRLAALFQRLDRSGALDRNVLLVTSDHGEEFFEHGRALHDQNYEESVRIPLLVRVPGGASVGQRHGLVGLTDIAPTVRELAGLPAVPGQGVSFASALDDGPQAGRTDAVMLDSGRGSLGLITERWKLFPTRDGFQLYDLANDPDELDDLLAVPLSAPPVLPALRARLDAMLAQVRASRQALGLPADPATRPDTGIDNPLSEEAIRQLEALGYTR